MCLLLKSGSTDNCPHPKHEEYHEGRLSERTGEVRLCEYEYRMREREPRCGYRPFERQTCPNDRMLRQVDDSVHFQHIMPVYCDSCCELPEILEYMEQESSLFCETSEGLNMAASRDRLLLEQASSVMLDADFQRKLEKVKRDMNELARRREARFRKHPHHDGHSDPDRPLGPTSAHNDSHNLNIHNWQRNQQPFYGDGNAFSRAYNLASNANEAANLTESLVNPPATYVPQDPHDPRNEYGHDPNFVQQYEHTDQAWLESSERMSSSTHGAPQNPNDWPEELMEVVVPGFAAMEPADRVVVLRQYGKPKQTARKIYGVPDEFYKQA